MINDEKLNRPRRRRPDPRPQPPAITSKKDERENTVDQVENQIPRQNQSSVPGRGVLERPGGNHDARVPREFEEKRAGQTHDGQPFQTRHHGHPKKQPGQQKRQTEHRRRVTRREFQR